MYHERTPYPDARVYMWENKAVACQDRPAFDPAQRCLSDNLKNPCDRQSGESPELARDREPPIIMRRHTDFVNCYDILPTTQRLHATLVLRLGAAVVHSRCVISS